MTKHRDLNLDDPFPPSWTDALQEFIGAAALNFRLVKLNATTLRGEAGTGNDQAGLAVNGLWRYRSGNYDVAHPGGAAATFDVWGYASDNEFSNAPVVDTDNTDYNWYLAIRTVAQGAPTGNTPAAKPIVATRKVGEVVWDGAAITQIRQMTPAQANHGWRHAVGGVDELPANSVGASQIIDGSVGAAEIATDGVGSAEIAAGAVGPPELATDSVGSIAIAAGAVGSSELATDSVGAAAIAAGAVGGSEIAAGAVDVAHLAQAVLDAIIPIGSQVAYGGTGDPNSKWLLCDGRFVSQATYPTLFGRLGHTYNAGVDPGNGTFKLPDKRGRVSVGADTMGTAQGAAGRMPNTNRARGQNHGEEQHALSVAETPTHTHAAGVLQVVAHDHAFVNPVHVNNGRLLLLDPRDGEMDVLGHTDFSGIPGGGVSVVDLGAPGSLTHERYTTTTNQSAPVVNGSTGDKNGSGSGAAATAHNVVQPGEIDNWIIRVL
jgi:microcystin-dependent protein